MWSVLDFALPLAFFGVLSSYYEVSNGLPIVYDQKQVGELNLRAEIENVSFLFIPSSSKLTSVLTGLMMEFKGGHGKSALTNHPQQSKDAYNQHSVNLKQIQTQPEDVKLVSKDELNQPPVTLKQVSPQEEKTLAETRLQQISSNEKVTVKLGVDSSAEIDGPSKDQLNQPPVTLKQVSNKEELEHKENVLIKNVGIISTEVKAQLPPQIESSFKPDNKKPSPELQEAIKASKTDAMEPIRIIRDRISAATNDKIVIAQSTPVALRVGVADNKRKIN